MMRSSEMNNLTLQPNNKYLTKKEFEDALKTLKLKQAPDPDKITNAMLTHLDPKTKKKPLQLFNESWKNGKNPTI
jgi:hypothetical protein